MRFFNKSTQKDIQQLSHRMDHLEAQWATLSSVETRMKNNILDVKQFVAKVAVRVLQLQQAVEALSRSVEGLRNEHNNH